MTKSRIGIIAGSGQFPKLFAEAARKAGREVVIVAHQGESWPELESIADRFCWVKLGQLGRIIGFFREHGVTEAVIEAANRAGIVVVGVEELADGTLSLS